MKKTIIASIVALAMAAPAMAGTILAYDTTNQAGEVVASEVAAGVTAFNLKRDFGLIYNSAGADYNSRNWTIGGTEADAVAAGDQLVWGFTSTSAFDLTTLEIAYDRSEVNGPFSFSIQASINGGLFNQIFADLSVNDTTQTATINLGSITGVTQAFFRMPGWGANGTSGTFDIETGEVGPGGAYGLALSGMPVAAVPLPAGLPLLAGALGLMGFVRRKRKAE